MLAQKFGLYLMKNWETETFAYGTDCWSASFSHHFDNTGTMPAIELSSETDHPVEFSKIRIVPKPDLPLLNWSKSSQVNRKFIEWRLRDGREKTVM